MDEMSLLSLFGDIGVTPLELTWVHFHLIGSILGSLELIWLDLG